MRRGSSEGRMRSPASESGGGLPPRGFRWSITQTTLTPSPLAPLSLTHSSALSWRPLSACTSRAASTATTGSSTGAASSRRPFRTSRSVFVGRWDPCASVARISTIAAVPASPSPLDNVSSYRDQTQCTRYTKPPLILRGPFPCVPTPLAPLCLSSGGLH